MPSPFDLDNTEAYQRWREHKLAHAVTTSADLIVEINDPTAPTAAERAALLERIRNNNMVVYATRTVLYESGVQQFGARFGLNHLDANWLAGEQGITRITVCQEPGQRQAYIPYTDKPIKWHTDGYYNTPERQIRAMVLHCVQSAGSGGDNRVMDHEMAYLLLRDANPDFIRMLSTPEAMTIPERCDDQGVARAAQSGPVFSVNPDNGALHMRYTARTRSIVWHESTREAVAQLEQLLASDTPYIHHLKLEPGMGLLCNNILHDRTAFTDDRNRPRLLYRARYLDRVATN